MPKNKGRRRKRGHDDHRVLAPSPKMKRGLTTFDECRCMPLTRQGDNPTPILIRGVERRVFVKTDRNAAAGTVAFRVCTYHDRLKCFRYAGRPYGLYGNAFGGASAAAIKNACVLIQPPTISNIIALEAPPGGRGTYRRGTARCYPCTIPGKRNTC